MNVLQQLHHDERGGPMAEYLPLLALLGIAIIFSLGFFGGAVRNLLGGECPAGQWDLVSVGMIDPKHHATAAEVDKDGNGFVCVKSDASIGTELPGNGNTGKYANVKDNN